MVAMTVDRERAQHIESILDSLTPQERQVAKACFRLVKGRRPTPTQVAQGLRLDPKKVKLIHAKVWDLLKQREAVHLLPQW